MTAAAKKATTVAIVKDSSDGIEVLLMRRHLNDVFLPDYYVFPGGALDVQDSDYKFPPCNRAHELKDFNDTSESYYAHVMCGIRETFEESGLLFALDVNGSYPLINTGDSVKKFSLYRKLVYNNELSFREMLAGESLLPAVEKFFYIDRWITPSMFPVRYDARFFAAVVPSGQEISHDNNELTDFQWLTPGDALQQYRDGGIKLVMPTVSTLELLNKFHSSGDMLLYFRKTQQV